MHQGVARLQRGASGNDKGCGGSVGHPAPYSLVPAPCFHQCLRRPPPFCEAALSSAVVGGGGISPGFMGSTSAPCFRRNWPAVTTRSPALRPLVMISPVSPAWLPVVTACIST